MLFRSSVADANVMKEFTDALISAIDRVSTKKSVEPPVFSGDVLEFADWEVVLDTYLRVEHIGGKDRRRHLKNFSGGEAKACISGLLEGNTDDSYVDARAKLKQRYGSKRCVSRTFRQKLMNWPRIQPKDGKGLPKFGDFLSHLRSAMSSFPGLKIVYDGQENEKLVMKLPDWLKNQWARIVARAERVEDRYPSFSEFAGFIQEEAHVMMLPISQHSMSIENAVKLSTRNFHIAIGQLKTGISCLCCEGSNHDITKCFKSKARK